MGISVIGLLLTDFNFIFVSLFTERVPGGYWFLLLGPVVEGSLGGNLENHTLIMTRILIVT